MSTSRILSTLVLAIAALSASAQTTTDHAVHHPAQGASSPWSAAERMAGMDAHMKAMQAMHDKMAATRSPEERQALMAENMKLMQDGMTLMGGMGPGMGMGMGKPGTPGGAMTPQMRQQMMEKRMDMMQSMMQMMMDRMPMSPAAPAK